MAVRAQLGNADTSVSDFLKAWVIGSASVCGLIGDGTSIEIVSNWEAPFAGDSLGSRFGKVGAVIQMGSGLTSKTSLASRQIWESNEPYLFNLVLSFYALTNPQTEVMDAILALEKMMAPDISQTLPMGRIPQPVGVNIGRKRIFPECCITNMSEPLDKERDSSGNLIRADVTLQIQTLEMVTAAAFT